MRRRCCGIVLHCAVTRIDFGYNFRPCIAGPSAAASRAALIEGATLLARVAEPTDAAGGPEAVLRQMERLIAQVAPAGREVRGIGVCSPGPLDSETGTILNIPTLPGWDGLPLRDILAENEEAVRYRRQVWGNGARVPAWIERPPNHTWTSEQRDRFVNHFRNTYTGDG